MIRWLTVLALMPSLAWGGMLFTDTFDRASTSGTMEDASGKQWKDITANFEISGNHVQCKVTQACNAVGALVSNETTSQADVVISALYLSGTDQYAGGGTCRNRGSSGSSRNFWRGIFADTTVGFRIIKYVGGTQTVVSGDAAANRLSSARMQLLCSGSNFTLYENGVAVKGPVTDAALPTGFPGIYDENIGTAGLQLLDNFAVCDAVAECDSFSLSGAEAGGPSGGVVVGEPSVY